MSNFHKEVLFGIINEWNDVQLDTYIHELEERMIHAHQLLKELKAFQRKKKKRKVYETGPRGAA